MSDDLDQIKTYVMSASAGIRAYCDSCAQFRAVWVGETEGGDTLACCGTCQYVIKRQRTDSIPKLSVNSCQHPYSDLGFCIDCGKKL